MTQIKTITKDSVAVYPTTKTRAVTNNEGALLDDILNQKSDKSITLSGYGIPEEIDLNNIIEK